MEANNVQFNKMYMGLLT